MLNFFDTNKKTLPQQVKANKEDIAALKADVKITPKGEFNENTLYKRFDVVTYAPTNNTYICIVEGSTTISGILPTDSTRWCLYALGGLKGEQGTPGQDAEITPASINDVLEGSEFISVDFNEQLTKLKIELDETNVETVQATEDSAKLITSGAVFDTVANKQNQIIDSEDIIQDTTEDKLYINNDLKNKINTALLTPADAPLATEIVAVDETNAQKMLGIGEGLSVEDGVLKAAASGETLYRHNLYISTGDNNLTTQVITKSSEPITSNNINEFLYNNNFRSATSFLGCSNGITVYGTARSQITYFFGLFSRSAEASTISTLRTQTTPTFDSTTNTITYVTTKETGVWGYSSIYITDTITEL